jgi:RNA polymerase sigma-70 factor (ECF subfamily)
LSSPSESDLQGRLRAGDREALSALFRRHRDQVHALCARLTDDEAAGDLLQETFLRVWKYRRSLAGTASFSTWLYTVTRNVCLDHLRRAARENEMRATFATQQVTTSRVFHSSRGAEQLDAVREAVSSLPPKAREALVLSRYHGLTYREIGCVCGCSEDAVKLRIHRAMKKLRAVLLSKENTS